MLYKQLLHSMATWTSVDIPIGDFTGMTWDNIIQMKFDGGNGSTDAIYVRQYLFLEIISMLLAQQFGMELLGATGSQTQMLMQ